MIVDGLFKIRTEHLPLESFCSVSETQVGRRSPQCFVFTETGYESVSWIQEWLIVAQLTGCVKSVKKSSVTVNDGRYLDHVRIHISIKVRYFGCEM